MSAQRLPAMTDLDVYLTKYARFALVVVDRPFGYGWLRARGFPAFWCRKRGGFLARPEAVPDLVAMARYERRHVTQYNAAGPRQARLRRLHATNPSRRTA